MASPSVSRLRTSDMNNHTLTRHRLTRILPIGLALGLMSGCGLDLPTEVERDDRTLLVWGYVMSRGNPARGGAGLVDPAGFVVATTPVELGKYLIGLELPSGTRVCDGYRVRVAVEVGRSSELDERLLEPSSGGCVVPDQGPVQHTLDFSFPEDADSTTGGAP